MSLFRQIGVTVLLLLLIFAPVIACASPHAQLSPAEQACCHTMRFQCEQMAMPTSHGCCHNSASLYDRALAGKVAVPTASVWLRVANLLNPATAISARVDLPDYITPQPPPSAISILRI